MRAGFTACMLRSGEVVVYDYVDENEPILAKMAGKREAGYRSLGYQAVSGNELPLTR